MLDDPTARISQLGVLRACTSAFISTCAAACLSEVHRIRLHKLCDRACPSLSTISFGINFPKDQHLPNQTINKLYPIAHSRFTASERMILIHCFLTDPDHVSALVKSLRSIDNPPFKHGHISAFPNTPKSGCNNKKKNMSICGASLHPNREPIPNGILFNNSPKTKKERTEQVEHWHIYT